MKKSNVDKLFITTLIISIMTGLIFIFDDSAFWIFGFICSLLCIVGTIVAIYYDKIIDNK